MQWKSSFSNFLQIQLAAAISRLNISQLTLAFTLVDVLWDVIAITTKEISYSN